MGFLVLICDWRTSRGVANVQEHIQTLLPGQAEHSESHSEDQQYASVRGFSAPERSGRG